MCDSEVQCDCRKGWTEGNERCLVYRWIRLDWLPLSPLHGLPIAEALVTTYEVKTVEVTVAKCFGISLLLLAKVKEEQEPVKRCLHLLSRNPHTQSSIQCCRGSLARKLPTTLRVTTSVPENTNKKLTKAMKALP